MGFFLPVPPVAGGATEKSWHELARRFVAQGHEVTMISRRWEDWYYAETDADGIRHLRLRGHNHTPRLWRNLLLDWLWSRRAFAELPDADIVVVHAVTLPLWLGRKKPSAGKVVLMTGRMPKGQYRRYRHIARVIAPSSFVRDKVIEENPALADRTRVYGYPIDAQLLSDSSLGLPASLPPPEPGTMITLGYIGRIHEEKGLRLLTHALALLAARPDLPPWRVVLCGPFDVARGGSGEEFRREIEQQLAPVLPDRLHLIDPQFNEHALAGLYRQIEIFCYPSLAEQGETFGVAVAEAMAAGAVPVVSGLPCFRDFVRDGETGLSFDHTAPDAANRLADALGQVLADSALRRRLSAAARTEATRYDYATYAARLLEDFASLARG
jgi:glycosyltransferase involved in cell wall biosynthesis